MFLQYSNYPIWYSMLSWCSMMFLFSDIMQMCKVIAWTWLEHVGTTHRWRRQFPGSKVTTFTSHPSSGWRENTSISWIHSKCGRHVEKSIRLKRTWDSSSLHQEVAKRRFRVPERRREKGGDHCSRVRKASCLGCFEVIPKRGRFANPRVGSFYCILYNLLKLSYYCSIMFNDV
jgi:hypothetical protein